MNPNAQKKVVNTGPIAAAVYYLIIILLIPFSLVGVVIMTASLYVGKKTPKSGTALAPLNARWFMHNLGSRLDGPSNRLMMAMSGFSATLGLGPMIAAHWITGYMPNEYRYPFQGEITIGNQGTARQTLYDQVVEQYLPKISQFVLLGAGFDTRALLVKETARTASVRSFEIDTPATLAYKREKMASAGIDTTGVTFVPADFEKDDWLDLLIQAGFNLSQPAVFIWEGVTLYLDKTAVEDTLRKVASTAKGSILAFDYFTSDVLESQAFGMRSIRASLNAAGEPLKFGVDCTPPSRDRLAELLQSSGLTLVEQRTFGQETGVKRSWGGFAISAVA